MSPIREFDRRSARVEAMRLDDVTEMGSAAEWLESRGLHVNVRPDHTSLTAVGLDGTHLTARLGQWLAFDPGNRAFTVYDHGDEPGQFGREHDNVGVQD